MAVRLKTRKVKKVRRRKAKIKVRKKVAKKSFLELGMAGSLRSSAKKATKKKKAPNGPRPPR